MQSIFLDKNNLPYAEARGIRIDIINKNNNKDIQELIDIKLAN